MNLNILLLPFLFVLIKAESMLESSQLEDIIELKPETKETRNLDCCLAAEIDSTKDLMQMLQAGYAEIRAYEGEINELVRRFDATYSEQQETINDLDGRIRGMVRTRDYTLNGVQNSLNALDERIREAQSMLESSPLEDIIELKPETKETQTMDCCSAAATRISQTMKYHIEIQSITAQDAAIQMKYQVRIREQRIEENERSIEYLYQLLRQAESMLESSPLEDNTEVEPETKETRSLDCCSSTMSDLLQNIGNDILFESNKNRIQVAELLVLMRRPFDMINRDQDRLQDLGNRIRGK